MDLRTYTRHAVVLILTMGVALTGSFTGTARADLVDRVLVMVNDDIILLSELEQIMSKLKKSYDKRGVSSIEQQRLLYEQRPKALEKLIRDKLTDQQVARYKLEVDDKEVDATIGRIRDANKLTEEEFRRAVELEGLSYETYRKQIKDQILRSRLLNWEVRSKIVITEADIKTFYDAHIDRYTGSTKYKLRHILLKLAPAAPAFQKDRVSEEIKLIQKRMKDGEPFEKLAKEFSDAPTAANGGQLGVFGTNLLTKEIITALEGLQPKEVSPAVETEQGYQLFFVEDIIQSGGKTLEEATPEIRDKLYADVVDQRFKTWIEDLRQRSHIQILE